ncbi:WXG100 family type VII secretion target [Amycolatopsis jejuensis]|uniref:WXG100 family type VII secretion target n=1 Tax=Amycolatopsis jejuensis TaxID=330084 RepID=UPI0005252777|nr:WXG100 family type VII secretion target [Amycolatopsis jejuensis]
MSDHLGEIARQYFEKYRQSMVPIDQIVSQLRAGDPAGWHQGVGDARQMATQQEAVSQDLTQIIGDLESVWSGGAADKASGRLQQVRASMIDAHQAFLDNSGTHTTGVAMFENLRNQLSPMPAKPDLAPGSRTNWYEYDHLWQLVEYSDAANKNLQLYQDFSTQTQANSGRLKYDYGAIGAYDGGDVTIDRQPEASRISGGEPVAGHSAGVGPGHSPGTVQPGPGGAGYSSGTIGPGPTGTDHTSAAGYPGSTSNRAPGSGGFPGVTGNSGGQGPGASGYLPGAGFSGDDGGAATSGPGNANRGSGNATRVPGSANRVPGSANRGPGNVTRGPGGETGTRTGGPERGGRVTAGTRTAGERGLPGVGTAGGRGGKKEEDEEHERKYVLDVDLFADDEPAVDPETGLRPAPPTLGA